MANAECGTAYSYRLGCRCQPCKTAHAAESKIWKRKTDAIPELHQKMILEAIASGLSGKEFVEKTAYTWQKIRGIAAFDQGWSDAVDQALMEGRDPNIPHGEYRSYRWFKCRCPECLEARRATEATWTNSKRRR